MPRSRPAASGYARLAQAEEEEYLDDSGDEQQKLTRNTSSTHYAPVQPGRRAYMPDTASESQTPERKGRRRRRRRTNSGVDVKAINARLEKWAEEIASKFKLKKVKGKSYDEEKLEIHYSVFQAPDGIRPASASELSQYMDHPEERMNKMQFDDVVESVRVAIELGMHPKMITQGSSGSYFARNSDGKVVGVFKPKDEEPYASKNPKWTKWIHRNLFPFFFGRACLIPNLSYVSEAAAYVLDTRLQTNIVPYTDIVHFSSIAFNYDFWDRHAYYRKRKPLPPKVGSLQVFLKGYRDATLFLKEHPWPDQPVSSGRSRSTSKRRPRWTQECRPGSAQSDDDSSTTIRPGQAEAQQRREFWTEALQLSFREELEKLVILDYIMRNTDRGLDNWMIRIDKITQKASIVAEPPNESSSATHGDDASPYHREDPMSMSGSTEGEDGPNHRVMLGAIDNSLSWPWKHPDAWRSFPFGWLFLPVSLIGQPFTEKTRKHFLPLLTSKQWWSDTQIALRHCFSQDSDFQERMFARQISIVKGQAWNVVETLKIPDHGPLELTRRARVQVWDDLVDIPTTLPLQSPTRLSADIRRHQASGSSAPPDEMDISAVRSPVPASQGSILDLPSQGNGGLPNPNKFTLSTEANQDEAGDHSDAESYEAPEAAGPSSSGRWKRPDSRRSRTRLSYDDSRIPQKKHIAQRRNMSFTARTISDHEDDDGDLGYSVARDMESNRRKVIVERLETVKAKNPVFTWC